MDLLDLSSSGPSADPTSSCGLAFCYISVFCMPFPAESPLLCEGQPAGLRCCPHVAVNGKPSLCLLPSTFWECCEEGQKPSWA